MNQRIVHTTKQLADPQTIKLQVVSNSLQIKQHRRARLMKYCRKKKNLEEKWKKSENLIQSQLKLQKDKGTIRISECRSHIRKKRKRNSNSKWWFQHNNRKTHRCSLHRKNKYQLGVILKVASLHPHKPIKEAPRLNNQALKILLNFPLNNMMKMREILS